MALELSPAFITLDNMLPDMMGFEVLKVLREEGVESKVVIISAVGQQKVIEKGIELGASDYIVKPFSSENLKEVVNRVMV